MEFPALALTLRLAAWTTVLLLLLATPLAAWIASGQGWGRRVAQALIALPLILPPTVLGFYLLVGLGPQTAVGRAIGTLLGYPLAFTFTGLVVASTIYSLPFAVQPLVAGFSSVDPKLMETARILGASRWAAFRLVVLPLTKMSFLTSTVLTFAHTVGEFGVVLMVGGDIPGVTRTLSIAIFDRVQEADYAGANHLALWLLLVSFAALLVVYSGQTRKET